MQKEDIELVKQFRKSPIFFIEKMWRLVPQPLKPEYQERAKMCNLSDYRADWFMPFEKGKHITWQQWVILLAVEKSLKFISPKKISIASGHGIGKSSCLSWLIIWYLFCFKDSQIPCTAPTSEQIHDVLWKEIAIWLEKMPKEIANLYEWSAGYVRIKESPETWFARARTARKENPEALAGIHGDYVMILADEASGIDDAIFRPAEGAMTNESVLICLISNPTRLMGYFYETHHSDKLSWQTLRFSSEDSPIVEKDYCARIKTKYGQDSDEYRFMVQGNFPKADTIDDKGYVQLITPSDLKNTMDEQFVGRIRLGIDPAGEGKNETSWVARDKFKAKIIAKEKTSSGKSIAQKTITLIGLLGIKPEPKLYPGERSYYKDIIIDGFGIGVDAIKELALAGYNINSINVGDKPKGETLEDEEDRKMYLNIRAMVYDRLKKWVRSGGELVNAEKFKELLNIKYRRELSGKMKIMSKEEMRKLGIQSPDDADALSLTFVERENNLEEENIKIYKQPDILPMSNYEGV